MTKEQQMREAFEAIKTLQSVAGKAARLNNDDHIKGNSVKAHKILCALAGWSVGYLKEVDDVYALLDKQAALQSPPVMSDAELVAAMCNAAWDKKKRGYLVTRESIMHDALDALRNLGVIRGCDE